MKHFLLFILFLFSLTSVSAKTIEMVVVRGAGGPLDLISRKVAKVIEESSSFNVVVVNVPGASGNIGFNHIVNSNKPILIISTDLIVTNKLYAKEGYPAKIIEQVEPLFFMGEFSNLIVTNSERGPKNVAELLELGRTKEIRFGHSGVNSYSYNAMMDICKNINCLPVPYKSASFALLDLAGNTIDAYSIATFGENVSNISKINPILILSSTKNPLYPDVPTLPNRLAHLDSKSWLMLFSKGLSGEERKIIENILKKQSSNFFTDSGLWYSQKNPQNIWRDSLEKLQNDKK